MWAGTTVGRGSLIYVRPASDAEILFRGQESRLAGLELLIAAPFHVVGIGRLVSRTEYEEAQAQDDQ
jgi:hypothetical protein